MKNLLFFFLLVLSPFLRAADLCGEWFEHSRIDPRSRDCFSRCFHEQVPAYGDCSMACEELCKPDLKIWLYFANGMFNSQQNAMNSLEGLNKRLYPFLRTKHPSTLRFLVSPDLTDVAYNEDEAALMQFLEVVDQWGSGQYAHVMGWLSGLEVAPDWFRKKMIEARADVLEGRQRRDFDLQRQIRSYLSHLETNDVVFVVAHSQGNFYRDEAFGALFRHYESKSDGNFGSISVATPSDNASPGLQPMGDNWYTTLTSDPVIAAVPRALPANVRNRSGGLFDHLFISNYLDGDQSGPKILEDTACVLSQLNGVLFSPTLKAYDEGCHRDPHDD